MKSSVSINFMYTSSPVRLDDLYTFSEPLYVKFMSFSEIYRLFLVDELIHLRCICCIIFFFSVEFLSWIKLLTRLHYYAYGEVQLRSVITVLESILLYLWIVKTLPKVPLHFGLPKS